MVASTAIRSEGKYTNKSIAIMRSSLTVSYVVPMNFISDITSYSYLSVKVRDKNETELYKIYDKVFRYGILNI